MCVADPAGPAGEGDQWLVFEVTDTGCGISQHGLGSLFTEYVQVQSLRDRHLSWPVLCPSLAALNAGIHSLEIWDSALQSVTVTAVVIGAFTPAVVPSAGA